MVNGNLGGVKVNVIWIWLKGFEWFVRVLFMIVVIYKLEGFEFSKIYLL